MIDRARSPEPIPSATVAQRAGRGWADLLPRLGSGVVMIVLALVTAYLGGDLFALFWLVAAVAVHWEWQLLVGGTRRRVRFAIGTFALAIAVPMVTAGHAGLGLLVLGVGLLALLVAAQPGLRLQSMAGLLYAGALACSVNVLRFSAFPYGLIAILWLFAVVWGTDIMAYFGGRLIGGPKLWPRLSPSKTWSGFLVGVVSGAVAGLAIAPTPGSSVHYLAVGLLAGVLAQGGDLFESALKRRYGVKDSSNLIPGHGGVMDRLDGFIAAATFAACLGAARFGVDFAGAGLFQW